eukprot:scaffold9426_cov90-Isochrysis_galbana.AAC.3
MFDTWRRPAPGLERPCALSAGGCRARPAPWNSIRIARGLHPRDVWVPSAEASRSKVLLLVSCSRDRRLVHHRHARERGRGPR